MTTNAVITRKRTSELMVDFLHLVEKHTGRRLTQDELLSTQFRGDALAYAKTMMRWIRKDGKSVQDRKQRRSQERPGVD